LVLAFVGPASVPIAVGAQPEHVLRFTNVDNVTTLNPALSAETTVGLLGQLTMAYLVRYDAHNRPLPELATVVPTRSNGGISADGKTITWHLRADAKWSDGVAFDSGDVAFSVAVMQNPANTVVSHDGFSLIERVDTPNATTAVFHLKEPYAAFLPRFFGSPPGNPSLLPAHLLSSLHDINQAPYNALPVGIGPFRYVAWRRNDAIEMEANPYYFRGKPKLDRIVDKIIPDENTAASQLQTGELDLIVNVRPTSLQRVRAMPGITIVHGPSYRFIDLNFNVTHPQLADRVVRQALRLAIDRPALLQEVFHDVGLVQESFVPPQYAEYEPLALVAYDPARANALLEGGGWHRGPDGVRVKDGRRLAIDLETVTGAYPEVVELLRTWWTAVGVEVDAKFSDPTIFYQPLTGVVFGGKFDAAIISIQNFPFVYPSLIYGCARIPPNGLNIPRYCNPKLDALMTEYETTYDPERQHRDLVAIARLVADDVPMVVLEYTENVFAVSHRVVNFHPNAITFFDDVMSVDD
jgi:peptide/nickel transport system substrate-binding protein